MNFKKILFNNKNFKIGYYSNVLWHTKIATKGNKNYLKKHLDKCTPEEIEIIKARVDYYNQLTSKVPLSKKAIKIKKYKQGKKEKIYFLDTKRYLKYFDNNYSFEIIPGDVITVPESPAFVKSRPLNTEHKNSIILNLNKVRHFNFIQDDIPYLAKKDILIGRLAVYQAHRKDFYEKHFNNPICDLGDVAKGTISNWLKPKISITEHLKYKFILALEGNDVATNLKWIMSSNSIAVMPTPKYETWFMEGTLIPDHHYIHIKDDYSNLNEKLEFYIKNPNKATEIIQNAQNFVEQFKDKKKEHLISIAVMQKYFNLTN